VLHADERYRVVDVVDMAFRVAVLAPKKIPTPLMPMTPPVSAQTRACSSVMLRGCSHTERMQEWL